MRFLEVVDLSGFSFQSPLKSEAVHFHGAVLEQEQCQSCSSEGMESSNSMGHLQCSSVNYSFPAISIPVNSLGFPPLWNSLSCKLARAGFKGSSAGSGGHKAAQHGADPRVYTRLGLFSSPHSVPHSLPFPPLRFLGAAAAAAATSSSQSPCLRLTQVGTNPIHAALPAPFPNFPTAPSLPSPGLRQAPPALQPISTCTEPVECR